MATHLLRDAPPCAPACLRRLLPTCCSNDVERKGTDFVAHGGAELPEFANNILAKLEILAAKAGYSENFEGSTTTSPRGSKAPDGMTR